jgi:hypothetical protein
MLAMRIALSHCSSANSKSSLIASERLDEDDTKRRKAKLFLIASCDSIAKSV